MTSSCSNSKKKSSAELAALGSKKIGSGSASCGGKRVNLALLAGGVSAEREVSLSGAKGVEQALGESGRYNVRRYDPAVDLQKLVADAHDIDFAFVLLHGLFGEDGTIQGLLDLLNIPYQGSGVLGSALAMDKNLSKELYRKAGLLVADCKVLSRQHLEKPTTLPDILDSLGLPLVVKPLAQGSSLGMSIVDRQEELLPALEDAFRYDERVMAEVFIKGRELTCAVLGNEELSPLPVVEIIPGEEFRFFDYQAKYRPGATREICPADLTAEQNDEMQRYACEAHRVLQLSGYSRSDMILADDGLYILETNTIPGMTPTSLLPLSAQVTGLSYAGLVERLIELGMAKR